jgi:hypothetical protein
MKLACIWQKAANKNTHVPPHPPPPPDVFVTFCCILGRFSARGVQKHHANSWEKNHVENVRKTIKPFYCVFRRFSAWEVQKHHTHISWGNQIELLLGLRTPKKVRSS